MLGNFVLSSGYYDAYYVKAKRIQQSLTKKVQKVFEQCDAIVMPTTFGEAFKRNSKQDPVAMYAEDMFTIFANLTGLPSISVPYAKGESGLPLGMQIMGKIYDEQTVLDIASCVQTSFEGGKR